MNFESTRKEPVFFPHGHKGPLGEVLSFVSAKGGTGKTILSAATAYTLLHSGVRVVTIDADFSTRGLSLFLLGSVLESYEFRIRGENCLADSILEGIPVSEVSPLKIVHGEVEYNIVISNKDVWRSGVSEERFRGRSPLDQGSAVRPEDYCKYLWDLCDRFRKEYDYIIIDTRGGFDPTSAAPATVADGYVVVLEADKVSVEQVADLKEQIDKYAASMGRNGYSPSSQASLKGFIVNKAIHSVDEDIFSTALARLYNSKTFGVIPIDKYAIRAYQKKTVPQEKFPDSDFSYYSLLTIERLISPSANWSTDSAKKFTKFLSFISSEWHTRQRVELARQAVVPVALMCLAAIFCVFYLSFKLGTSTYTLRLFSISSTVFVLLSIFGAMLSTLSLLRTKEFGKSFRYGITTFFLLSLLGLGYLTGFDIPNTFSQNVLLQRVQERDEKITSLEDEKSLLEKQRSDLDTENKFLKTDREQITISLQASQNQVQEMTDQLSTAKSQAAAIKRDRDAAQGALSATEQRATSLQQRLDDCQRRCR